MKIVCLASGGVDSSVLMFLLQKKGHKIFPVHINYGQKSAKLELESYNKVCKFLNLKPIVLDVRGLKEIKSGLTTSKISPIENPFFPNRNLLFLVIGSSYAFSKSIKTISVGFLDNSEFSDQNKEFVKKAEELIKFNLNCDISLLTPMIDLDKKEVFNLAKKYNFPLNLTYSCYAGTNPVCGKCHACKDIINASNNNLENT